MKHLVFILIATSFAAPVPAWRDQPGYSRETRKITDDYCGEFTIDPDVLKAKKYTCLSNTNDSSCSDGSCVDCTYTDGSNILNIYIKCKPTPNEPTALRH